MKTVNKQNKSQNDEYFKPLTSNDTFSGRTAPLTSKRFILYIYSTNIGTEYFKHGIYSPFFSPFWKCSLFHNSNVFGYCIIHILYTGCAKIKKNNAGAKRLKQYFYCPKYVTFWDFSKSHLSPSQKYKRKQIYKKNILFYIRGPFLLNA